MLVNMKKTILLTFDVEDWFQVENFKEYIPFSTWDARELRVEKNTIELLDLLESISSSIKATFFILGWVAERCPDLVREIQKRGHEVASHGFDHHLCYNQTPAALREDLVKSKELLEKITGVEVAGYRAPSFSVTDDVLQVIKDVGYLYDSSYNSFDGHGRYGKLTLPQGQKANKAIYKISESFYEIPVSNLVIAGKTIPWGGGGYFRLTPASLFLVGVNNILKQNNNYTFYMHPWEIDSDQPRVKGASTLFRFRHYVNLSRAQKKLKKLIMAYPKCSFSTCSQFVQTCAEQNELDNNSTLVIK